MNYYHTIEISPGEYTRGWPEIVPIVDMVRHAMRRLDWAGKRVLDIGCRDGALSFEAERLGAAEVIGIDFDLPEENLRVLTAALSSRAYFRAMNLFALTPDTFGRFDVVILSGVLYHLRYPFSALRLLRDVVNDAGALIIETATLFDTGKLSLMYCPVGADSPYEPTSCTFFNIRGLTDTLSSLGFGVEHHHSLLFAGRDPASVEVSQNGKPPIDRTVFICRRKPEPPADGALAYWDGVDPLRPGWNE